VEGIDHVAFTAADIVRHPLVTRIVNAYEAASVATKRPDTG
jgi:phosphate starvation-inducible protein PhoH and related proteins